MRTLVEATIDLFGTDVEIWECAWCGARIFRRKNQAHPPTCSRCEGRVERRVGSVRNQQNRTGGSHE